MVAGRCRMYHRLARLWVPRVFKKRGVTYGWTDSATQHAVTRYTHDRAHAPCNQATGCARVGGRATAAPNPARHNRNGSLRAAPHAARRRARSRPRSREPRSNRIVLAGRVSRAGHGASTYSGGLLRIEPLEGAPDHRAISSSGAMRDARCRIRRRSTLDRADHRRRLERVDGRDPCTASRARPGRPPAVTGPSRSGGVFSAESLLYGS